MNGLVDAVALALSVGRRGERSAGQEAEGARDDGGLVGDDVAEQVARDDNAVEARGFLTISMAAESIRWWPSFN